MHSLATCCTAVARKKLSITACLHRTLPYLQAEEDDATRAEVEQLLLMSRVEEIKEAAKQRDARSLTLAPELRGQVADMGHAARRRAAVLAQLEGSDDGEDEDEVDWRAKKL